MTEKERQNLVQGFTQRFKECVEAAGSIYALAKKCGVSIPTLKRYLAGSEPSLTMLVRIAEAANVSVGWLASGVGECRVYDASEEVTDPILVGAAMRLRDVLGSFDTDGARELAGQVGSSPEEINLLISGARLLSPIVLWRLIDRLKLSPEWLATGKGFAYAPARYIRGANWSVRTASRVADALSEQLARVPEQAVEVHRVQSDSLAPKVAVGDIAYVDKSSTPESGPGTFLVQQGAQEFLAYVTQNGPEYEVRFSEKQSEPYRRPVGSNESEFRVVGRLIYLHRLVQP